MDKGIKAAKQILNIADNKEYNLIGKGQGSKYESFTMNYEYLAWWLSNAPSRKENATKIYVTESANGISVEKNK